MTKKSEVSVCQQVSVMCVWCANVVQQWEERKKRGKGHLEPILVPAAQSHQASSAAQ